MLTDPAHNVPGSQFSPNDLRTRHAKRMIHASKRIGEPNEPVRGDHVRRKHEDSHADGDVQSYQAKCQHPDPPGAWEVGISTSDHISAELSVTDSGGASRRA